MSEETSKFSTALSTLFPLSLLFAIDFFTMLLQPQSKAISHLAVGVLAAQLICILLFTKGEMCLGQRGQLSLANAYVSLFWGLWFVLSLFSNFHFILTDMLCLCGIAVSVALWKLPHDAMTRKAMLALATGCGLLGLICYLLIFIEIPFRQLIQYNIFSQLLMGLIFAYLLCVIARNRLHNFHALLPLAMLLMLFASGLASLVLLYTQSAVHFYNEFAFILYFALHLVILAILAIHILKQWRFNYHSLLILLTLSASLPMWMGFAYSA